MDKQFIILTSTDICLKPSAFIFHVEPTLV